MGKLDIPYIKRLTVIFNNEFWCQWCCGCGLRHLYHFKIIRGKTPKEDRIEMCIDRDEWATAAAKTIAKYKKQIEAFKKNRPSPSL